MNMTNGVRKSSINTTNPKQFTTIPAQNRINDNFNSRRQVMFYCDDCAKIKGWPEGLDTSYSRCEICGRITGCYDVPSKYLPIPKTIHTQ